MSEKSATAQPLIAHQRMAEAKRAIAPHRVDALAERRRLARASEAADTEEALEDVEETIEEHVENGRGRYTTGSWQQLEDNHGGAPVSRWQSRMMRYWQEKLDANRESMAEKPSRLHLPPMMTIEVVARQSTLRTWRRQQVHTPNQDDIERAVKEAIKEAKATQRQSYKDIRDLQELRITNWCRSS